jgi:Protein of unknown function (DUF2905)
MNLGRLLILAGLVLVALGLLLVIVHRLNVPIGRLPGDIVWRGKNTTFYFPWVTCLLLSLLGTLLLWLFNRRP